MGRYVCAIPMRNELWITAAALFTIPVAAFAQTQSGAANPPAKAAVHAGKKQAAPARRLTPGQQFVMDVVKSAVGRREGDPQDRLRVLSTAISVVSPVDPAYAKRLATEGVQVEAQLIGAGEKPAASIMETGQVSCTVATQFVDGLPAARVADAEQSIIGAVGVCPQAAQAAEVKLDSGTAQGQFAPRAFMATAERTGVKTAWAQSRFEKMMGELPDAKSEKKEAPNFAAMYARMAPEVDKSVAQKAGIDLLLWLSQVEDGPERNLAIKIMTGAMKQALGSEAYEQALRSDVIAQQTAALTGSTDVPQPEEENVSVLSAMQQRDEDQSESIRAMPPAIRARQAAAAGFARGTAGSASRAQKYFDIAFPALDEAWEQRQPGKNVAAVVEEVCEAAAQVNTVDALKRAEQLQEPAEQAIGMLAVARTVLGKEH